MNKVIQIVAALLLTAGAARAQGIKFEQGQTWQQLKEKAKKENKYIFMDCYATWCGPCKFMSKYVFTQREVGDYINEHFISVAVQTDQTPGDPEDIRKWYADAKSIVGEYSIYSYPTYLFFTPGGKIVHRILGSTGKNGQDFIAKVKEALDSNVQYYTQVENYKTHLNDSSFLRDMLTKSIANDDMKSESKIADAYFSCLKDPYAIDNLQLITGVIQSSKDKGFVLILNNIPRIDSIFHTGNHEAEFRIWSIIAKEDIAPLFVEGNFPIVWQNVLSTLKAKYPSLNETIIQSLHEQFENQILYKEIQTPLYKKGADLANWDKIARQIKKRYPGYDARQLIASEKPRYFLYKKMWQKLDASVLSYMEKYGDKLGDRDINSICWSYVFMHSTNRELLLKATQWIRHSIPDPSDTSASAYHYSGTYQNLDTYANLLYKTNLLFNIGDREDAIRLEKETLGVADKFHMASDLVNFKITLERMERGENTWEGRDENSEDYK